MLRILSLLPLIALNVHGTLEADSIERLLTLIGFDDSVGLSTCTKLNNNIFLGVYHGAYPEGFSFSQKFYSPQEISEQPAAQEKLSTELFSQKWKSCALLNNYQGILYIAEKEGNSFTADKVVRVSTINADVTNADVPKKFADGAVLLFLEKACPEKLLPLKFWQPLDDCWMFMLSDLSLKSNVPKITKNQLSDWQEVSLLLNPLFGFMDPVTGYFVMGNITSTGGMSGGLLCSFDQIFGVLCGVGQRTFTIQNADEYTINLLYSWSNQIGFGFKRLDEPGEIEITLEQAIMVRLIAPTDFNHALLRATDRV